jgi:hypothetical protein
VAQDDDDDDPAKPWWQAHAHDTAVESLRRGLVDAMAAHLRELGGKPISLVSYAPTPPTTRPGPPYRSLTLRCAQYWNDNADDECHLELIGSSERDAHFHDCHDGGDDEIAMVSAVCDWCTSDRLAAGELISDSYGALVPAMQAFCREHASQDMSRDEAYRPWAIARFADGVVTTELVGQLIRPWLDLPTDRAPQLPVDDRVLAIAGELDARGVLVDALLEAGDPRGEPLAHDAITRELARSWLGALDPHVPRSALVLRRGVPDSIGLYLDLDRDFDRDEQLPFAFRPAVRFLPHSARPIWPALALARTLGPLDEHALLDIATQPLQFAAREIDVIVDDPAHVADAVFALAAARPNLPALALVRLIGAGITRAAVELVADLDVPLEVTTVGDDADDHVADLAAWRDRAIAVAMFDAEAERACGWVVARDGSIAHRGYHRGADAQRATVLRSR